MTSTTAVSCPPGQEQLHSGRFPVLGLLALAMAAFVTLLTEALPAGLLPLMSTDLGISEALVGQLVTVYALGSLLAAIPLTAATQGLRRRPLLLLAIVGFTVVNTITAMSEDYAILLGARFLAGVFAGLMWALLAGYASRMVAPHLRGRAISLAMVGVPLALSIGIPAGAFVGSLVGWRVTFGLMSAFTILLVFWVLLNVPDFAGRKTGQRFSLGKVFAQPGIRSVLAVTLTYVLAHNILYTYIAPFLTVSGLDGRVDLVLLVFGLAALVSIWAVGVLIDRHLRELALVSTILFLGAAGVLSLWGQSPVMVCGAIALWGLAFGAAGPVFQTASAKAAGEAADVAQSMIVTVWNIAIAGGGVAGGVLLESAGAGSLPLAAIILLAVALVVIVRARKAGFASSPSS